MKRTILSVAAIASLAACGGSGGTAVTFTPTGGFQGEINSNVRLNAAGDKIIAESGGVTTILDVGTVPAVGTFVGGRQVGPVSTIALVSETDASRASVMSYGNAMNFETSAAFRRLRDTVAPTSGSAVATGDYVALVEAGGMTNARIVGDARLVVNFDNETVRGRVTNRELQNLGTGVPIPGTSVANLQLIETGYNANGRFSGTTTGGGITSGGIASVMGASSFEGLVAGDSGGEIVGGTTIESNLFGNAILEVGAFATGH